MVLSRLLYDGFGALYAMSLVLLFVDAIQPRRAVNRTALVLLFAVFSLQTGFLFARLYNAGYLYSPFDALLLISWLVVLVALVVDAFFRVDLLLFFANLIGFGLVVFDAFAHEGRVLYTTHTGDLLVLHICLALLSYVAFAFSFVFSLMYYIQDSLLRQKKWNQWYFRLPSLDRLDAYMYRSILIGIPLLLIAIVLGAIWSQLTLGKILWTDPKSIATYVVWLMYGLYLFLRSRSGWSGRRLVWYAMGCFAAVVLNLLVVGSFSIFHHST